MNAGDHAERFVDPGDTIYSLMAEEVLVTCPRCGNCATHKPNEAAKDNRDWFAPRRLICTHCTLVRDWAERSIYRNWRETPARDDYFNEILWLRGDCGSNEIWAYNWRHLDLVEKYVAATHRQHVRDSETGWANSSFVNRLPRWITSAKNREDVLRAINRIRRSKAANK